MHSTIQQYCGAAVVFLKCSYSEKSADCYSHTTHVHLGDAPYSAPLSRCTGTVGEVEDLAQGHLISRWGQEIIRSLPAPEEV